jgi:hypothetical protein
MTQLGVIVRLLMLVACLVPFTSIRQAAAVLAVRTSAPIQNAPAPQEDDSERTEQAGREKERITRPRVDHRSGSGRMFCLLSPVGSMNPTTAPRALPTPPPLDHFRNGLGTPYRC